MFKLLLIHEACWLSFGQSLMLPQNAVAWRSRRTTYGWEMCNKLYEIMHNTDKLLPPSLKISLSLPPNPTVHGYYILYYPGT